MSKKDARESSIKQGLERLREAGVDTDELSASSVPSLASHLAQSHETDLAVAFLLGRIADAAAVDALVELERRADAKEIKREARRSLFKLEQRGVSVRRDEEARARSAVINLGPEIEGYLCVADGSGHRLIWLARPQSGGGLMLLQALVSDRTGLLRAGTATFTRKEMRAKMNEIKESRGISMTAVPWEYADHVLYIGYEKTKSLGHAPPEHFTSMRASFNPMKPKPASHPIHSRLSAESARAGDWRGRSRRLLDEPEFRYWILDEDWMRPFLERIEEAQGSRLILNDVQKEERFLAIVRDATRAVFRGESGAIFRNRMEDMALCLLENRRNEMAGLSFAVSLQLAEQDLGILDISFLTGLVQKSIAYYLAQAKERAAEEPSLIVKP